MAKNCINCIIFRLTELTSFDFDCIRVAALIQGWHLLNFFSQITQCPLILVLIRMSLLTNGGAHLSKYGNFRDANVIKC